MTEKKLSDDEARQLHEKRHVAVMRITKSAVMLAITLLLQFVSKFLFAGVPKPFDTVLAGSLVNLCLLISVPLVGVYGGLVVAFTTPIVAFLTGHMAFAVLIFFIGVANASIVGCMFVYDKFFKKSWVILIPTLMVTCVIKFLLMYFFVLQLAAPLGVPTPALIVLQINFSWPQLVSALVGSLLFIPLYLGLQHTHLLQNS